MKKIIITISLFSSLLYSQNYPKDFIFPLQIPISLSANYAELRNNHFHAGLDIRTQQRIGLKIIAPQDGYVSRINISAYGYGKAIYITHPNGYTTVYGHLSSLYGEIEDRARKEQYKKQSYSVDFHLKPNEIPVKQGDLVAFSGNTGGSGGPHLHFEVRDSKTEEVLNPFLFGFDIPDHIKPQVSGVWIYPINGMVNDNQNKVLTVEGETYDVSGELGFGVKAYDKQDGSANINGIYFIKTYVNDKLISNFQADKHAFDETRFINATTDYKEHLERNSWIYRTYLLPGNTLQMYEQEKNKGILKTYPGEIYAIRIEVGDFAGNITTRNFTLKGIDLKIPEIKNNYSVKYNTSFTFTKDEISLKFDKGSFYENFDFTYQKLAGNQYQIHNSSVPVHKKYFLSISPDWNILDKNKSDKYMIVWTSNFGKKSKEYLETNFENGVYKTKPKDLGVFSLELDETAPTITCPALNKTKKIGNRLSFIIKDSDSGIKDYNVFIDGNWVLAEYEYKLNSLFIPDLKKEGISSGLHQVEVIVTDKANNKKTYNNNFEKL